MCVIKREGDRKKGEKEERERVCVSENGCDWRREIEEKDMSVLVRVKERVVGRR